MAKDRKLSRIDKRSYEDIEKVTIGLKRQKLGVKRKYPRVFLQMQQQYARPRRQERISDSQRNWHSRRNAVLVKEELCAICSAAAAERNPT